MKRSRLNFIVGVASLVTPVQLVSGRPDHEEHETHDGQQGEAGQGRGGGRGADR